jgi:PAS domain S-box-containing protein
MRSVSKKAGAVGGTARFGRVPASGRFILDRALANSLAQLGGMLIGIERESGGATRIQLIFDADVQQSVGATVPMRDFEEFLEASLLPEEAERWRESLDLSALQLEPYFLEFSMPHPAGGMRTYRHSATPTRAADGAISWIGLAIETARSNADPADGKRHDQRLKESAALLKARHREFRMVEEIAKIGHWIWSSDLKHGTNLRSRCSAGAAAIFGVPPSELELSDRDYIARFLHPDDRERIEELLASEGEDSAGRRSREYRIRRPDGTVRWIHEVEEALSWCEGRLTEAVSILQDITDRKQAELALREREERLHAALDVSRTSTYRWNLRTNAIEEDDSIHRLIGVRSGAIRNLDDYFTHVHPADRARLAAAAERSAREGMDLAVDYRVIRPDGGVLWMSERGRIFFDDHGRPLYMTGAITDITERKMFEEHQRLLLAELSHRVKNTLAVVHSIALQTLRRSGSLEAFGDSFRGRISALSRAHSLLTRSQWKSAGLEELIRQTLAPYGASGSPQIEIAGPQVALRPKPALALALVLHELATNAVKYGSLSAAAGRLCVRWTAEKGSPLRIDWRESGGPAVSEPCSRGFGRTLIEQAVAHELDGAVQFEFLQAGLICRIHAPLTSELAAPQAPEKADGLSEIFVDDREG